MEHLLLRPSSQTEGSVTDESVADLSFLELADADGLIVPYSLYREHMTLVICGWSNMQWTGYVFTQADKDNLNIEDMDELKGNFLASEYGFDFTAPPQSILTWDARSYWLRLVAHRSQYVLREWLYLVRTVEEGVEAWVSSLLYISVRPRLRRYRNRKTLVTVVQLKTLYLPMISKDLWTRPSRRCSFCADWVTRFQPRSELTTASANQVGIYATSQISGTAPL